MKKKLKPKADMRVEVYRLKDKELILERDRLREVAKGLVEALNAVSRLDYLQEHNALANKVRAALELAGKEGL